MVNVNNATQKVEPIMCADLSTPETIEKCGDLECPKWVTSDWSPCKLSRCLSRNRAIQKRGIICKQGDLVVKDSECDEEDKPVSRQECHNTRCLAIWRNDEWREVRTFSCFFFCINFFFPFQLISVRQNVGRMA